MSGHNGNGTVRGSADDEVLLKDTTITRAPFTAADLLGVKKLGTVPKCKLNSVQAKLLDDEARRVAEARHSVVAATHGALRLDEYQSNKRFLSSRE